MSVRARTHASAVITATCLFASPLLAAEPTTQELLDQIKELQSKVEQLEARQNRSSAEVTATVEQMVKDAQARSRLFQTGDGVVLAGHDANGFFIRSSDDKYLLIPSLEFAFRNDTNFSRNNGEESVENGFDIARLRLRFEGHAFTPNLTYAFQFSAPPNSGEMILDDAWVRYQFHPGWYVTGGQFKDPLLHEQLISSRLQLAADRPLLVVEMTGSQENFVQGVTVMYDGLDQPWRITGGFTDGITSENTNFEDFPVNSTNFGVVGRVEYFAKGNRKEYEDYTAAGNTEDLLVFGAATDFTQGGSDSVWLQTLDAQWENTKGVGLYASYVSRVVDIDGDNSYDWGVQAQGSYLFAPPKWEGFVRYEFMHFGSDVIFVSGDSENAFNVFTVGMNYYLHGQAAKFTIDASYLPNGAPNDQPTLGILSADEAEFLLRTQFQLVL